ncbi:MAG: hypothetical protein BGO88_04765 [Flavobacterium sp. 38-13]|uniref:hypothetical protein n=1 Tax=Flavobacterium sp. 38-13 TaxID=1896168 RepID=UPI00096260B9|nr:hypothetical protein [Flavobacterium sp. 38-13]OJX55529.1 MAG: hypothetical protein BGO88_04765 [Flavobacterium sp. 38-13]
MKNKYLRIYERPMNSGRMLFSENVNHLSKLGINKRWELIQSQIDQEKFVSVLTETKDDYQDFNYLKIE